MVSYRLGALPSRIVAFVSIHVSELSGELRSGHWTVRHRRGVVRSGGFPKCVCVCQTPFEGALIYSILLDLLPDCTAAGGNGHSSYVAQRSYRRLVEAFRDA